MYCIMILAFTVAFYGNRTILLYFNVLLEIRKRNKSECFLFRYQYWFQEHCQQNRERAEAVTTCQRAGRVNRAVVKGTDRQKQNREAV